MQIKFTRLSLGIFIASAILLLSLGVNFYFLFSGKKIAVAGGAPCVMNKYSLLDPHRDCYGAEDLITNVTPLRNYLSDIEKKDPNVSIYFEMLTTGANIVVNKDAEFFPASLTKLPLAMSAVKKIERGDWHWDDELVIMPTDKDSRFGDLYKQPVGTRVTIEDLVRRMLVDSDNTAYLMVLRNLEPQEFNEIQQALGLDQYFSQNGKISAKRYAVILRSLYFASYLSPEDSQKMLTMMSEATQGYYLGAGVGDNVAFAHKIGVSSDEGVQLDAGVVFIPNRPYMIIMMVKTGDQEYAKKYMTAVSKNIFDFVSQY